MTPRVTRLTIEGPNGRLDVELADEGAGEYVVIRDATSGGEVGIDPDEWPHVSAAVERLLFARGGDRG